MAINGQVIDGETGLILSPATPTALTPLYNAAAGMQQMRDLQAFVNTYLQPSPKGKAEGDYGVVPGTEKPTLLKSGADKLCDVYGLLPLYEELGVVEDWAAGLFAYRLRCRIVLKADPGRQVGEGVGACNSRETRYQGSEWWNGRGDPPTGEGWEKIKKRNGETAWKRKVANSNPADLVNTVFKMAKKRALVDAVLSVTRSSGLFTQDMEDYIPPEPAMITAPQQQALDKAFTLLAWTPEVVTRYLRDHLTEEQAGAVLQDLRTQYSAAQKAAAPAGEPASN